MSALLKPDEASVLLEAAIRGDLPDERGRFGPFGGRYVPETLVPAFERLEDGVREHLYDESFQEEFQKELKEWVGRPTALTFAPRLSESWGADVWLKREDLAHTGAHKINNAIGQAILAKRLGAERVIAETGAGQHGVASAAACARVGLPCTVYMGAVDIERQAPNVDRMRRLGADVVAVESGDKTLRAAIDEALRNWVTDPAGTYYLLGSAVGAHPYPYLVRELQSVIGKESRQQMIRSAPMLAVNFAHKDHTAQSCLQCHHNFNDDTGSLPCFECHKTNPEVNALVERQFHDFCRWCHVKQQQLGEPAGPVRQCIDCHVDDPFP